jgi:hypothetical protein
VRGPPGSTVPRLAALLELGADRSHWVPMVEWMPFVADREGSGARIGKLPVWAARGKAGAGPPSGLATSARPEGAFYRGPV